MINNTIILGLTGPTGAGKTTAASAMKDISCYVINADKIARSILSIGSPVVDKVCEAFGEDLKKPDGEISRIKLAERAFKSIENTNKLNSITHPAIIEQIEKQLENIPENHDIVVLDAPLLFEGGLDKKCDFIVSIIADEKLRRSRIMKRDCLNETQAKQRMAMQKDNDFYINHSDYILDGNGRDCDLYRTAIDLILSLREKLNDKKD